MNSMNIPYISHKYPIFSHSFRPRLCQDSLGSLAWVTEAMKDLEEEFSAAVGAFSLTGPILSFTLAIISIASGPKGMKDDGGRSQNEMADGMFVLFLNYHSVDIVRGRFQRENEP